MIWLRAIPLSVTKITTYSVRNTPRVAIVYKATGYIINSPLWKQSEQDKMKTRIDWLVVPTALAISLAVTGAYAAQAQVVQLTPKFQPDPLVVRGTSGGAKSSDCGNIAAAPNQVIQVTESLPYLRLSVQSDGQPTLLINGPGGRFCVLGDSYPGGNPEISGYWKAGRYSVYVGDRAQGQHPYTLSISQQNKEKR